jgi:hypothetical protein
MHRIIQGPDKNMWFTELKSDRVGRVDNKSLSGSRGGAAAAFIRGLFRLGLAVVVSAADHLAGAKPHGHIVIARNAVATAE